MNKLKTWLLSGGTVAVLLLTSSMTAFAAGTEKHPSLYATGWALLPPIVAIGLALLTKEVYSSLFIGVLVGAFLRADFKPVKTMEMVFDKGIFTVLSDPGNIGILVFLVLLGAMVCLMNSSGGSEAFGAWTSTHIKTRVGAQLATILLGMLIFVDDYFNCLTVGSVMRPVTDRHNVSRAKLAYLIDATAAPVCIIAPISSWAAAVSGYVEGQDGLTIFVKAIPYNFYALLTIVMMVGLVLIQVDYGPMHTHEANAINGDLFTSKKMKEEVSNVSTNGKGHVMDLIFPIVILVISCVLGMLYTGGFFSGVGFVEAFSNSIAARGLAYGSFVAIVISIIYFMCRKMMTFKVCMECIPEGFKTMVSAILILTLAWTLKTMTDGLGADVFVAQIMEGCAKSLMSLLPAIIFLVGCFLAFATGTSWGTFGILIPIVVAVFKQTNPELMIISISACMAGAVCGDHCSPISDTTIMASAGSQCDHVNHVSTQLPYAITVAAVSFVTYIVAGFVRTPWISLPVGVILMVGVLLIIKKLHEKKQIID